MPEESPLVDAASPIVFFDGVCGFCNRSVNFLLEHDRRRAFRFAPLQGETAGRYLNGDARALDTLVVKDARGLYRRSSAIVRILWCLGGLWTVAAALLWLVPKPIRDLGYKAIARTRYRLFGKLDACRMPTSDERDRFLP